MSTRLAPSHAHRHMHKHMQIGMQMDKKMKMGPIRTPLFFKNGSDSDPLRTRTLLGPRFGLGPNPLNPLYAGTRSGSE